MAPKLCVNKYFLVAISENIIAILRGAPNVQSRWASLNNFF